jgi:predicted deacylase
MSMVAVIAKRSSTQVKTEVRAIKKAGNEINKSVAAARAFLRKNGFITKTNKVSKHYR